MAKSLVEVYSKYISKQANDLKYVGQPLVEETNGIVPEGPHKGKKVEDLTMDQHDQQLAHYHSKKIKHKYGTDAYFKQFHKLNSLSSPHAKALNQDREVKQKVKTDHWNQHVKPVYKKHGLSPEFAKAVNDHVAKHDDSEVYNHHGGADGSMPRWWDSQKQKVKKLKPAWAVDE